MVAGTPEVRQFPGGASNLTYLLRYPAGDLILRRPPVGAKAAVPTTWAASTASRPRCAPVFPLVAAMVAFCDDDAVLGSDFYVMERVEGAILRRELPLAAAARAGLRAVRAGLGRARRAARGRRRRRARRWPRWAAGEGYVARQVAGWTDRLSPARDRRPRRLGAGHRPGCDERQPPDVGQCLIHNDFRLDNLVLAPDATRAQGRRRCSTGRWPPSATR